MSDLIEICQSKPGSLALPEAHDPRTLMACRDLAKLKVVESLFLWGEEKKIIAAMDQLSIPLALFTRVNLNFINPHSENAMIQCKQDLEGFYEKKSKVIDSATLDKLSGDPLYQAAFLVGRDEAEAAVAGADHPTSHVIRAALTGIGTAPGVKTVSGSFLMSRQSSNLKTEILLFADCAVVVDPNCEQLVDIAYGSAMTWRALLSAYGEPHIAFLSFSTKNSANHPHQEKVAAAAKTFQQRYPHINCDGEIQFDAAFDAEIGQRKAPGSPIPGKANIFIFPDLDAGNISYKITQRLAHFDAIGPILQGLAKPYSDLSRGASPDDIVGAGMISMLQRRIGS